MNKQLKILRLVLTIIPLIAIAYGVIKIINS
jgi:hypothetical protein